MRILVVFATRHGATQGIAERVADRLRSRGFEVDTRRASEARDVTGYDAFVVGGAAYMFHWLKEATGFVKRHRSVLGSRPVWLFSSGPLGTDSVDKAGRDVLESSRPREFAELEALVHPRQTQVFFGAYSPAAKPVGLSERFVRRMPAMRDAMPSGDFRDWAAIDAWTDGIARELGAAVPT